MPSVDMGDDAGNQRQHDRMGRECLDETPDAAAFAACRLDHQRCGAHHQRQVHGEQKKQRHRAGFAIGLQNERNADKHRVGLRRAETVNHRLAAVAVENPPRDDHGDRPGNRRAGEIAYPVTPWAARQRRRAVGEHAEDQNRHRDRENIVGKTVAGAVRDKPGLCRNESDAHHSEDGQDNREHIHLLNSPLHGEA